MTTVAHKDTHIGADKRRTSFLPCGSTSYDDTTTKVFKFGCLEWGQAGMVGLTELLGLHLQGLQVSDRIRSLYYYYKTTKEPVDRFVGQVLVYDSSGKRFLLQTGASMIEQGNTIAHTPIPIQSFSIGSGSKYALPILMNGGDISEAINEATKHDGGTGGGIEMAHEQQDKLTAVTKTNAASVDQSLEQDGFIDKDGKFTEKALGYTATELLNLEELAKLGLVGDVTYIK